MAKKSVKKAAKVLARTEAKIILGSVLTIATHNAIQKVAKKYPKLSFLKSSEA